MKRLILTLLTLMLLVACNNEIRYNIGVSQCSEDDWRALLNMEIEREARFFGNINVENVSANDNSSKQTEDIERFIEEKKDLIIVAPNVANDVQPVIEKAMDAGIPVILIDRRTSGDKYTAFIGADNCDIGHAVGEYIAADSQGKEVDIVELLGLNGSSPAQERHDGFSISIANHHNLHLMAIATANWNEEDAKLVMDSLLRVHQHIEYVFAQNDRMALGAYKAIKAAGLDKQIKIVGVDGLVTPGGGVDMILNQQILASHTYPTGGSEAIQLAHNILTGLPYDREIILPSALVDSSNARVMHLQYLTMKSLDDKYNKLELLTDRQLEKINLQQWMLAGAITIVILLILLLFSQMKVRKEKRQADDMMMMQMTTLIPLDEQPNPSTPSEDKGNETSSSVESQQTHTPPSSSATTKGLDNQFLNKVQAIIIAHIGDSDFSVNDIANELGLSRVQLYRKIKTQSDQNVNELIRTARLKKAYELLHDVSKNVSEVAYEVGFSSPSYFTRCFKEYYGKNPSDVIF